jgi:pyrroline-5-carboxylate reductase
MKLAFVGGGNMAAALIGGLRTGPGASEIVVVERDAGRRTWLQGELHVACRADVDAAVADASVIVVAVKPADVRGVCEALRHLPGNRLVLSIAAGISTASIAKWCASEAVVRAMPNTPALVGRGITGLFARAGASQAQRVEGEAVLRAVGTTIWFDEESMLDAVTAISGSGPAYVFYFMEALQAAALQMGMGVEQARKFALETFAGAAQLAVQSDEDLAVLRERVTSKGGTTAAALESMRAAGVFDALVRAAMAARERSRELGKAAEAS